MCSVNYISSHALLACKQIVFSSLCPNVCSHTDSEWSKSYGLTGKLFHAQHSAGSVELQQFNKLNPLKCSGIRQLHLKVFNAIQV